MSIYFSSTRRAGLLFLLCSSLFLFSLASCSEVMSKKDNSSLSFIVPLSTITAESEKTDTVSIRVTVSGDYSCTQTFSRSCSDPEAAQMINTISLDGIPIGSSVTVSLEIFRDSTLLYQGTSDPFVVQPIENAVTLPLSAVTTP